MRNPSSQFLKRALLLLAGLLILKVTAAVLLNYRNYLPPNFESDFLRGRELYFSGSYQWAFYTHIASGPFALLLGLVLVTDQFRPRFPRWHRKLGKIQALSVLLLVVPSGLWMAYYAAAGRAGALGLAGLALATGTCVALGWRSAVQRRFADHRRWMTRSFLLLCSAVVLRVLGGLGTVIGVEAAWYDPLAIWLSWLMPLTAFELSRLAAQPVKRSLAPAEPIARGG